MLDLADYLRPFGVRTTFCGPLRPDTHELLTGRGHATVRGRSLQLSKRGLPLYILNVALWILRLLCVRPHVVHLNYVSWGSSLAFASFICRIPIVGRAGGGYDSRNFSHRWIKAYAAASYLPHAKVLLESPLRDRVFVMGDLLQPGLLDEPDVLVRALPARRHRPRFVFVGQLVERKGLKILVEALAHMQVDAELLLVGGNWTDPGYPLEVRNLIQELKLSDRVHIENHRPDVLAIFRRCDAFVLPSFSEARARVIIEAMSVGLPVISTLVGGIPTLVADGVTGLLVPPSNPQALAVAMDRIAASPGLRRQFGDAGRVQVSEQCQPLRTARRFLQLYEHLAGLGPAPAFASHHHASTI